MKLVDFANSLDPDEVAHLFAKSTNFMPHLDLDYLQSQLISCLIWI